MRFQISIIIIVFMICTIATKSTLEYKEISWNKERKRWQVEFDFDGKKSKYFFENEIDAIKTRNRVHKKMGIPQQNPEIYAIPNQQKKEKLSQYKGVCWQRENRKWQVRIHLKGQKQKYGGIFEDELDAAKRVNQLCEELQIPLQNPEVSAMPNQQYQEECKILLDDGAIQAEFEDFIKILDENNDPVALTIRETLIAAIRYGKETKMTEINLQTKNGESALSIAAKHGFSNLVQFLISKGANKEHFIDKHHTPLSLAVSHNNLKVVQVLFEQWISPNSHQEPYLHLSPIFNAKSREIAQLLVDNDAITGGLYNNKNQTPLTVACQNGFLDVVEFFLDDGLNINHLDEDNKTPLFYALTNKHYDVANFLISKGAKNTSCEQKQKSIMSKRKY